MRQHLNVLLESRTGVEMNVLHDRLREIRSEANMNNVYGSSMQVNVTMRACSDYINNYSKGALDDYKRAVGADPRRFKRKHLKDFESDFLARMEQEAKTIRDLVESAVGGMIKYHGDPDGKWMQNYEGPSSLALKRAASEVALFNMQLLNLKPKFATTFKDWCEDKPLLVLFGYALAGAAALATLKAAYDIVAGFID
jgi:hypothetical protein